MNYEIISPEELNSKLKENNDINLVDVRSNEEFNGGHIPNSISIPLDNIDDGILSKIKDKNEKIFLYCKTGRRSKIAAEKLVDLGYNKIGVLDGGIDNWKYDIN